jgi:deoxycytidylate deaminase
MPHERPSWDHYFLDLAAVAAKRATCPRKSVGVVLVRDRQILATGYNGSLPHQPHCTEVGCDMEDGHCVPGDTVISKFQTGCYNTGHPTIRSIWEGWGRGGSSRLQIRAVNAAGAIVPDRVVDVWKTGKKPLLRLRTFLGRSVRTTFDHKILTSAGWMAAENIRPGHEVALNGLPFYESPNWLRKKYIEENRTIVDIAELAGCNRQVIRRRLDMFGIRRRPFRLGGWNRGMIREESHSYGGDRVSATVARTRSRRYALESQCTICGGTDGLQVHHRDENVYNDALENLLTLCTGCHNLAHTPHAKREHIVFDAVTDIREDGREEVFDLTTERYHNFVADGVVVHNCVRTVHAEANAVFQAAKHGTLLNGCHAYVTASPCWRCFQALASAGCWAVTYQEFYRDERIFVAAERSKILLQHLPKVEP